MLSFFPRDVLDEILNLIESVSEGFPTYSYCFPSNLRHLGMQPIVIDVIFPIRFANIYECLTVLSLSPILRTGDQVPTFNVFWSEHLQEVRLTVNIHVQSMQQM